MLERLRSSQGLIFLGLLLFAAIVRAQTFNNPVLGFDEQFYLLVGDRMLHGAVPWHSFVRAGGERRAAFRSTRLAAEDIDGLYTEAVLLNY